MAGDLANARTSEDAQCISYKPFPPENDHTVYSDIRAHDILSVLGGIAAIVAVVVSLIQIVRQVRNSSFLPLPSIAISSTIEDQNSKDILFGIN